MRTPLFDKRSESDRNRGLDKAFCLDFKRRLILLMTQKVAIIGTGFLGLTLGLRLANLGAKVTLFESASEIGGLASSWQIGDVIWDRHYHVTLLSDTNTRGIVDEIGLSKDFEWVETKTGFYFDGHLVSMSNAFEFLRFPLIGFVSKLRLAATIVYASRIKNWKALERVSVADWLRQYSGRSAFEKIWKPLLIAKLGDGYAQTSAAFIWATIKRMYAARNAGMKKEMFGYVRGGYSSVLKRFATTLREKNVEVKLGEAVTRVSTDETGRLWVDYRNSEKPTIDPGLGSDVRKTDFDTVVLTCPSDIAAGIVEGLRDSEDKQLRSIKYQGIICASLLTKKSLSPFYVTNIVDPTPFTGIIEMSALVDKSEFGGNALIYLPKYVPYDDELFQKTDEEIENAFLTELESMYPEFSRTDVIAFKVSKVRRVFPLPVLNYSERLPPMQTSVPGVFIVNSTHIVNGTLNVNETIQLAERVFQEHFQN